MILNTRDRTWQATEYFPCRVYLDDTEIAGVWYIDTEKAIVKTYDVLDASARVPINLVSVVPGKPEWEDIDGLWSKTLHGKTVRLEKIT